MKKYKLYLFDLDGTLLDSDPMIVETFKYFYKKYKPSSFKPDISRMLTFSGPPIRETLKQEFPELDQELILEEWRRESIKNYPLYTKLFPDVLEMFLTFKEKGINAAIFTNKHRAATNEVFKLFGLDKLNIFSICGDEGIEQKPSPSGIFKCMNHFGIVNKDEVIYIGDSIFDYETSKNAGVDFGLVLWSPRKLPKNLEIPVKIGSFYEFMRSL